MSIIKDFIVKQGLVVQGTATAVTTSSGALTVAGGASIANAIYAGGIATLGVTPSLQGTGSTTTAATQTLRVIGGGIGVVGDSYHNGGLGVSGQTYIQNYTPATSTATGALQVYGGVGIWQNLYVGGNAFVAGAGVITTATLGVYGVTYLTAGTDTAVSSNTGTVTVWNTSTLATVTGRGGYGYSAGVTPNAITIQSNSLSANTNSGALIVYGGVGIWSNINVGGTIAGGQNLNIATTASFGSTIDATGLTTASVTMAGGLAVAKTIWAQSEVVTGSGASLTTTATNAVAITVGGLGVAGSGLFGGAVQINSGLNSNNTNSTQALIVAGGVGVGGQVAAGKVSTVDGTVATTGGAGSLTVGGGAYIAQNLVVMSNTANTGTSTANALYVAGGVGIAGSLFVGQNTTFSGPVTFNGTATYVYSTNTFYTDNILELHTPPGGVQNQWQSDDGKDIGLRFHYYNRSLSTDSNAALVLADDSQILEWYSTGAEAITTGTFVGAAYGAFKTGYIQLVTGTNATSTGTGALRMAGGIGAANLWLSGNIQTASSSTVNQQTIVVNANGIGVTGDSYFAGNVGFGGSAGITVTRNAVISGTGATASTSTIGIQGLQVSAGGLSVVGDSYHNGGLGVSGQTFITNATAATGAGGGALQVSGGASVAGNLFVGGTIFGTAGYATTATNLAGGATGSIPYQTSAGRTAYIDIGLNNYLLQSNGTTATWQNPSGLVIGTAANAANIAVTGTNAGVAYYPAIVASINPATYYEQVYSTSTMSIVPSTGVTTFSGTVQSSTSTNGTLVVAGGVGIGGGVVVAGGITQYAQHNIYAGINATSQTTGSLVVTGGVGITQDLWARNIQDNGNRVVTSVTPVAGTAIAVTVTTATGPSVNFLIQNMGVTATIGTTYIGVSTSTGSVTFTNLGVQTLTAGTDTAVSANTGTITVWNTATLQSTTNRGASTNNAISITNTASSISTTTGALTVAGGVGIGQNINIGGTLGRSGSWASTGWLTTGIALSIPAATYTDTSLTGAQGAVAASSLGIPTITATGGTPTYSDAATLYIGGAPVAGSGAVITNPWSMLVAGGNAKIATTTAANSTSSAALVVTGGVGIGGALRTGDSITIGTALTGTPVNAFISNNLLVASYTGASISTTATVNLDVWSTSTYRTAKYMIQLVDTGFTPNRVHATEMMVFHDGSANIYKSEYGVVSNLGELGTFDAIMTGAGVTVTFTPSFPSLTPSALVVKAYRTNITA